IDRRNSAPPLNRFSNENTPDCSTCCWQACTLAKETPGAGIEVPSRYKATIPSTNRIFLRRSGVARADRKALSTRGTSSASPILVPANSLADPQAGGKRTYPDVGSPRTAVFVGPRQMRHDSNSHDPCGGRPARNSSQAGHTARRSCSCATEPPAASSFSLAPAEILLAVPPSFPAGTAPPPRLPPCAEGATRGGERDPPPAPVPPRDRGPPRSGT